MAFLKIASLAFVRSRQSLSVSLHQQNDYGCTYCLVLHACKDDVEHLCERGLGRGLVDEVLAGQVDVVARADSLKHGALVDFYVLRGHRRQQGLEERKKDDLLSDLSLLLLFPTRTVDQT